MPSGAAPWVMISSPAAAVAGGKWRAGSKPGCRRASASSSPSGAPAPPPAGGSASRRSSTWRSAASRMGKMSGPLPSVATPARPRSASRRGEASERTSSVPPAASCGRACRGRRRRRRRRRRRAWKSRMSEERRRARRGGADLGEEAAGGAEEEIAREPVDRGAGPALGEEAELGGRALDPRAQVRGAGAQAHDVDAGIGDDEERDGGGEADGEGLEEADGRGGGEDGQHDAEVARRAGGGARRGASCRGGRSRGRRRWRRRRRSAAARGGRRRRGA